MNILKEKLLKPYPAIICAICIAGVAIWISDNVLVHVVAMIALMLTAILVVKFDVSHPYFWYSFVFILYAVSYPILYITGNTYDIYEYTKSLSLLHWLALSIVLLIVGPSKVDYLSLNDGEKRLDQDRISLVIAILSVLATVAIISLGDFNHKGEIYSINSPLISIGFRAALILLIIYTLNLSKFALNSSRIDMKMSIIVFITVFLLVFYSGERDLLIRLGISFVLVYFTIIKNRKLNAWTVISGITVLSAIPVLAKFKYFGLTGIVRESNESFLTRFFRSEFQAGSKNLQILLLDESSNSKFEGKSLLSSFIRSFDLDKIFNIEIIHSGKWFNETYFAHNRAGQGFTLIGEGYINFGYLGVIIVFVFVAIILKLIYRLSNKSVYHFSYYVLALPIFMYSIRADVANILSPLITQNLLALLSLYVFIEIIKPKIFKKTKQTSDN